MAYRADWEDRQPEPVSPREAAAGDLLSLCSANDNLAWAVGLAIGGALPRPTNACTKTSLVHAVSLWWGDLGDRGVALQPAARTRCRAAPDHPPDAAVLGSRQRGAPAAHPARPPTCLPPSVSPGQPTPDRGELLARLTGRRRPRPGPQQFVVASWDEHLRQHARVSDPDQERLNEIWAMTDPAPRPPLRIG